jgi:hypothetical protein
LRRAQSAVAARQANNTQIIVRITSLLIGYLSLS